MRIILKNNCRKIIKIPKKNCFGKKKKKTTLHKQTTPS